MNYMKPLMMLHMSRLYYIFRMKYWIVIGLSYSRRYNSITSSDKLKLQVRALFTLQRLTDSRSVRVVSSLQCNVKLLLCLYQQPNISEIYSALFATAVKATSIYIQGVPGGMCQTSGRCSLC
jgi:hypothetical protein